MMRTSKAAKDCYTEQETADALGVTLARLHMLLDEHVFNDGTSRPEELTFTQADLALLGFWQRSSPNPKVVRMPKRV